MPKAADVGDELVELLREHVRHLVGGALLAPAVLGVVAVHSAGDVGAQVVGRRLEIHDGDARLAEVGLQPVEAHQRVGRDGRARRQQEEEQRRQQRAPSRRN
jgi:hypothetical protein